MIRVLKDVTPYMNFIHEVNGYECYSDPMLCTQEQMQVNLLEAVHKSANKVFGVFDEERIIGLFVFLIIDDEKYIEMLVGLSKEKDAYEQMMSYLREHYAGYEADFVYNPKNHLLKEELEKHHTFFYPEQLKMVLQNIVASKSDKQVELYSDNYKEQYLQIHRNDGYWTGDKLLEALDCFRILLAIEEEQVVGYIDITYTHDENEPFDVFVKEEYRRKGYAKAMLAKAIEMNVPNEMMLLVDVDNVPAIALYESLGFVRVEKENSITAHMIL